MQKRCLSDLTIKNDFMFGAVMINPENCKEFLEIALEIEIDRVDVSREKSMVYHPDHKGIRLDVYAKDENNTCYNVEMQMTKKPALGRPADIIKVKWIWIFFYQEENMQNYPIVT